MPEQKPLPPGIRHLPLYLDPARQEQLVEAIRAVVAEAPLFTPVMPKTGKEMSVRMTNCGPLGWVTDKACGYRYQPTHPVTGRPWPPIPAMLLDLWRATAQCDLEPEACLINHYDAGARMGLHQDRDDPTISFRLASGDVVVIGGEGRLAFHGVDRIYPGTSLLLRREGRINLTLRRVTPGR